VLLEAAVAQLIEDGGGCAPQDGRGSVSILATGLTMASPILQLSCGIFGDFSLPVSNLSIALLVFLSCMRFR